MFPLSSLSSLLFSSLMLRRLFPALLLFLTACGDGGGNKAPEDTTPDTFNFSEVTDADINTVYFVEITVQGINTATPITISGGEYSVDGGAFTSSAKTVVNGQVIRLRQTSSASYSSESLTTLVIGNINATFRVVTGSQPIAGFVEDHRDECNVETMPGPMAIAVLPDPFTTIDGTAVTTKKQWKCRREEVAAMLEHFELGEKPRNPDSVTGSLSGDIFTINVTDGDVTISFTVSIKKPAGDGPFPAVIRYGRTDLLADALAGLNVATISYLAADIYDSSAANQMAKDGAALRGQGIFYDLYGSDNSAGAIMAWAWGLSRIIDALAATPEAGIDPQRLAVTGCSRFGKGALAAGAFDERVALTIVQESGSGGDSSWRGIKYSKSLGNDIEQLSNLAQGTNWFRLSFGTDFSDSTVDQIPFDHHQLAGLVAPRALLNVEQDAIAWLGPDATYINNVAAREVFSALNAADAHTYSLSTGHEHCTLPASQFHWIQSYVKKYLLNQTGEPSAIETPPGYVFDRSRWIDWDTPNLQ